MLNEDAAKDARAAARYGGAEYRRLLDAARLQAGELDAAVTAAATIIHPSQQWLPDDLTAALREAADAWRTGNETETAARLTRALALAREHGYF